MLTEEVKKKSFLIKEYLSKLGINTSTIKDENLMLTSFIHKSYASDHKGDISYNERLEFLGDSVLGYVISYLLYNEYNEKESILTLYKIAYVKEKTLSNVAKNIHLDKYIFLGHGEEKTEGRQKEAILSDSLEALIGYICVDLGIHEATKFIKTYIYENKDILKNINIKSYKSLLQELVQKKYKEIPVYKDIDHIKEENGNVLEYLSEVYVLGEKKGIGIAKNKRLAQEMAAEQAYNSVKNDIL